MPDLSNIQNWKMLQKWDGDYNAMDLIKQIWVTKADKNII